MDDYISKPIDPEQLYGMVRKWIGIVSHRNAVSAGSPENREFISQMPHSVPASENSFPDLPGIDIRAGLERVAGNRKLFQKILEDFYSDYADISAFLREAVRRGDRESVRRTAHTLKSGS